MRRSSCVTPAVAGRGAVWSARAGAALVVCGRLPAAKPFLARSIAAAIAALRGGEPREYGPEDWVASCTTLHGEAGAGDRRLVADRRARARVGERLQWWQDVDEREAVY